MPVAPSSLSLAAFLAVVLAMGLGLVRVYSPARPLRGLALLAGWLGLTALPTALGVFDPAAPLPAVPLFFLALLACATALALRRRAAVATVPLALLVGLQGLRLPLELVLRAWVEQGVVPPQMATPGLHPAGANPDLLSGLVCLLAAPLVARSRAVAWGATAVGTVLLLNVIRVVVTSMPGPLQAFPTQVALVYGVPTVWIGSVCVAGAWALHLSAVLRLWAERGRA